MLYICFSSRASAARASIASSVNAIPKSPLGSSEYERPAFAECKYRGPRPAANSYSWPSSRFKRQDNMSTADRTY